MALPLLVLNVWVALQILAYLQSLVTIFASAALLAFILNYPVKALQRFRVPRIAAVLAILLFGVSLVALVGISLVPVLLDQGNELFRRLPEWIESGTLQLQAFQRWAIAQRWSIDLTHWISQLEDRLATQLQAGGSQILELLLSTVGGLFNLLLTGVVTFYLLIHGDQIWAGLLQSLPASHREQVRVALRQNFHNYFVGQFSLAFLMGITMTLAFVFIQIPFGLLFGLGVGVLAIFPFGTPLGIALVASLTALKSIWLGLRVLAVGILIDQCIENIVAPQILGKFTGLNPVWILAALLLGFKLGGLLGLVTAVPLASFAKTMLNQYRLPSHSR
ncbi:AI-2E family transporter [Lyngbya confervoides]|uniref:AI-2E family transporter n=1 Tax=Lyngbya confervoides BDU141951 TaxID=1574623 RepID=A0ABD4T7F9_9CYAN|nr:AI-2E family transporter [Lyngbya confervoides]MCM1984476.1 AI-2E family transporter [Lyngbya confervoides BDU141951]